MRKLKLVKHSNYDVCFRTKKLTVDVIRIQPGESLSEILNTPATAPQVKAYHFRRTHPLQTNFNNTFKRISVLKLLHVLQESEHVKVVERRAVQDAQTPEGLKSSPAVLEDSQLPLEQKKRKIQRNLRSLEQAGLVSGENKYQDIINDISKVSEHLPPDGKLDRDLHCFRFHCSPFQRIKTNL